jgi:hypothetical protein
MNMLSAMTISVSVLCLLSPMSHAYLKQLVTFHLRAVRFAMNSRGSCDLVIGLLRTCLSIIDVCSCARFIGLSTRKALSQCSNLPIFCMCQQLCHDFGFLLFKCVTGSFLEHLVTCALYEAHSARTFRAQALNEFSLDSMCHDALVLLVVHTFIKSHQLCGSFCPCL